MSKFLSFRSCPSWGISMANHVTIDDVARKAEVSRSTVSRVLNGQTTHIREETRRRVLEAAQALGYRPNFFAKGLKTRQSSCIGVITEDIESPFAAPILAGIQAHLATQGYVSIVLAAKPDAYEPAVDSLYSRHVEGIIFAMTRVREVDVSNLPNVPVVLAYSSDAARRVPSVVPDDFGGTVRGMQHLIHMGHRRIGFVSGPHDSPNAQQRLEAYRLTLQGFGIAPTDDWIRHGTWGDPDSGRRAALSLLAQPEPPTAIFAANDVLAVGVLDAAYDLSLRVPEDLSVLGFDNQVIGKFTRPRLSTVALPTREIGERSAEIMLALIDRSAVPHQHPVLIPCEIIPRQSTGSVPQIDRPLHPHPHPQTQVPAPPSS